MTGAGQVCCTGSPQESEYKQLACWAPPHHTQLYLVSAVWQRLQSDRPTEQLYRVTEGGEGFRWMNRRTTRSHYVHSGIKAIISRPQSKTRVGTHHTDPENCPRGRCPSSSRTPWRCTPPPVLNTSTREWADSGRISIQDEV